MVVFGAEAQTNERQRCDVAVGIKQLPVHLEAAQGIFRVVAPLAIYFAFEIAFVGKGLLNLLIAIGVRVQLIRWPGRSFGAHAYQFAVLVADVLDAADV